MKRNFTLFTALLFLLPLSGCIVLSQHPLYEKKDLLAQPDITGVWVSKNEDSKGKLTFERQEGNTYKITVLSDGKISSGIAGVVNLNGRYFLNIKPLSGEYEIFKDYNVILRLTMDGKTLKLNLLNSDWLKDRLITGKLKVDHFAFSAKSSHSKDKTFSDTTGGVILTASTQGLQKFIAQIANEKEAFYDDDSGLVRVK